jgi:hypothetical protein
VEFEIQHEGRNPYFFFGVCEGKHDVPGVWVFLRVLLQVQLRLTLCSSVMAGAAAHLCVQMLRF